MGSRISIAIMVVIVLGVALYVFQSGSFSTGGKQSSGFFQSLLPHFTPSTSTALKFSQGNVVPPSPRATSTVVTPATSSTRAPINPLDIPPGYTESQLSPYFHRIRFGGISSQSISLNAYLGSGVPTSTTIDVTGWQIKSNRGGEFLPQAVNLYDPLGLAPATDILLKNGDTLNLYPTSAPVNLRIQEQGLRYYVSSNGNACKKHFRGKAKYRILLGVCSL